VPDISGAPVATGADAGRRSKLTPPSKQARDAYTPTCALEVTLEVDEGGLVELDRSHRVRPPSALTGERFQMLALGRFRVVRAELVHRRLRLRRDQSQLLEIGARRRDRVAKRVSLFEPFLAAAFQMASRPGSCGPFGREGRRRLGR
jgi:hypothetical protein